MCSTKHFGHQELSGNAIYSSCIFYSHLTLHLPSQSKSACVAHKCIHRRIYQFYLSIPSVSLQFQHILSQLHIISPILSLKNHTAGQGPPASSTNSARQIPLGTSFNRRDLLLEENGGRSKFINQLISYHIYPR